jgi:transcription elongation GreA/GreB family factor
LSVAFNKEGSAETASETLLPDRPVSSHPSSAGPTGLCSRAEDRGRERETTAGGAALARRALLRGEAADRTGDGRAFIDSVTFGSTVTFSRGDGRIQKYRIVGEDEADPKAGTISFVSPVARSLMGKTIGDVIEVSGHETEITAIN